MAEQWHEKSPTEIASQCSIDLSLGLSEKEAKLRLKEVGPNLLSKQKRTSPFIIFLQQFESVVIWVLLGAVLVSFLLDEKADAIAILAIVILNAIIGFFLEYRADRAMLALQQMAAPKATVLRDGHAKVIAASDIVPGDILLFESGDLIAADARLFELSALKVNEAPLTGESIPVAKNLDVCTAKTPLADRKNMVFMGTSVADGTGRALVVATGMQTEMGHIAKMLGEASRDETPLQKKLNQVGSRLLWLCFFIIIAIFGLGLIRNIPLFSLFMSSVSLAVAAIPEGLPAVVTVALALGVQRMVRRSVLVRRLSAVETLGCLQVICTDKTGTLTVGEMTARKLVTAGDVYSIHGEGYNLSGGFTLQGQEINVSEDKLLQATLRAMVACNNASFENQDEHVATVGDPTEVALLVAAAKGGLWRGELHASYPRIKELPFSSERKRMTVICRQDHEHIAFVKGAPELILERCTHVLTKTGIKKLTPNDKARMKQSCELMASEALRLLAFAQRPVDFSLLEKEDDEIENNLVFLGLIGLQDPPHASSKESISRCKKAGIKPVMITGDHPDTARAIAKELGILEAGDRLLTGNELENLSEEEFNHCVKDIAVYARVTAEHKLKIVRAWKKQQKVVAMTGDGVNDAPALKEASVGIAMGKTGTAVTKEASDIIVMDNNFTSIVAGIEEGRTIYDNIAKTLAYLLAGNSGELLVVFIALLIGWPLPLLPIQLLWINLVTDGLPAIGLATDMSEPGILNRPPRATQKSMMDRAFFKRVTFVGCLKALVILGVFAYEYLIDKDLIQAQDAAFSVLVTAELLWAFGARSDTKNIWQVGFFSNLRLFFIVSISFSLQVLIHHIPMLRELFGIRPVSFTQCLVWILLGMVPLLIIEAQKWLRKAPHESF
ncbi:TPA: cation-translocating P-type ATPase [Legionella pneumophila]|uniref:cation-translocating P-type ATPase n=1 Tax=Legionella pneumophila TaxID=446 RepID=UPI0005C9A5B4|nr:cation-translocating P-type ATPase [Legionella pneumophila]HCC3243554.1 cation-translocating P-type ATPase [Legionella pneumophila subsp. pneumophila]MCZ4683341.1 cation-translocating P-type ATPase [Legionella pneumophila]HDV5789974.1 cation-translocating P-type ATPase [Legionella pneumophila]HDV5798957.1 cation-translocating P-type ATPase [Legionella pneumophila]HDV5948522.1 cation-translocating P-type ATPase [Legionella pneumophila]